MNLRERNNLIGADFKRWMASVVFAVLNIAALVMFVWILKTGFEPLVGHAATGIYKALNFRGTLKNSDNLAVADGAYNFYFSIYDASTAGTCLYTARGTCGTPTAKSVSVTDGVFSTLIGDTDNSDNAITIDFNSDTYWLGVKVGTDAELTPRVRIGASGYAFNADLLDGLNTSSNGGTASFVPVTNNYGSLTLTGVPQTSYASSSTFYVNPASAASNYGLLGLAVGGVEKFKVDASGNVSASGTAYVAGSGTSTFLYGATFATLGGEVVIGSTSKASLILRSTTSTISLDTVDGNDNKRLQMSGGGAGDVSYQRGAYLNLYGNEYSEYDGSYAGAMELLAGNIPGSYISFYTGNTEKVRIANNGHLGIGTKTPSSTLEVMSANDWFGIGNGSATTTIRGSATSTFPHSVNLATLGGQVGIGTSDPGNAELRIESNEANIWTEAVIYNANVAGGARFSAAVAAGALSLEAQEVSSSFGGAVAGDARAPGAGTIYWSPASGPLNIVSAYQPIKFYVGGASHGASSTEERMRIDASGQVGIGTTAPSSTLEVVSSTPSMSVGDGSTTTTIYKSNIIVNGQPVCLANGANCAATSTAAGWIDGGAEIYLTTSGDKVTVGPSAGTLAKLTVVGDADEKQFVIKAFSPQTSNIFEIQNNPGNPIAWINNSGNFGASGTLLVGTAGTQNGTSTFYGDVAATGTISVTGKSTSTFSYGITFAASGGNVGIGTANPAYLLDVNGQMRTSGVFFPDRGISTSTWDNISLGLVTPGKVSSTLLSVLNTLYVGGTATTTIVGSSSAHGLATSTFYSDLSIVNRDLLVGGNSGTGWLWVTDGTATTSIRGGTAGLTTSTFQGDVLIDNLYVGMTEFGVDSGVVAAMNIPVSASATTGTFQGYSFDVDNLTVARVLGTADALGSIWDPRFEMINGLGTATTTIRGTSGTTSTFAGDLQATALSITSNSVTSTFANGIDLSKGCLSISGACITASGLGGANIALSNLSSVAINSSLLPGSNNSIDLGGFGTAWRNIYASSSIVIGSGGTASTTISSGNIMTSGKIFPATNYASDLGAFGTAWRDVYVSGTIYGAKVAVSSSLGEATIIVAASNSVNKTKADYICDGTADEQEIQAAITALPAGGGYIHLLEGAYTMASSTYIAKSNVKIVGSGKNTILRRGWDETVADKTGLIQLGDKATAYQGIELSNFAIDGNKTNYTNTANNSIFLTKKVTSSTISNLYLYDSRGHGIELVGTITAGDEISHNNFVGNNIFGNGGDGIRFWDGGKYNTIANNVIKNNGQYGIGFTIGGIGSPYTKITDNTIGDNAWSNIYAESGSNYLVISNNTIYGSIGSSGIYIASSDSVVSGNNVFDNADYGIFSSGQQVNISGNVVYSNSDMGIRINARDAVTANVIHDNGGDGIYAYGWNNISGNEIYANDQDGISVNDAGDYNIISGNNIYDNGGSGSYSGIYIGYGSYTSVIGNKINDTDGTGYAINIASSGRTGTYLADNHYSGTGASSINDAGTDTIYASQMSSNGALIFQNNAHVLGIGTTVPSSTLTVVSSTASIELGTGTVTSTFYASTTSTMNYGLNIAVAGGTLAVNGQPVCLSNGTNCTTGGSVAAGWTDGGDEIYLTTSADNVTVGGTGSLAKLTVLGDADEKQFAIKANGTQNANIFEIQNSSNVILTYITPAGNFGTSGTLLVGTSGAQTSTSTFYGGVNLATSGGNVGIGTAAPTSTLTVAGTAPWFTIGNGTASTTITSISTSTFANGIQLTSGCYLMADGTCAGAGGSSGANTALSNLLSVAINSSLLPSTANNNLIDLGGYGTAWRSIYASSSIILSSSAAVSTSTNIFAISNANAVSSTILRVNNAGDLSLGDDSFYYEASSTKSYVSSMETGGLYFEDDAGIVSWADMNVTTVSATGTLNAYSASINGTPVMTVWSTSTGSGSGISGYGVAINTSTLPTKHSYKLLVDSGSGATGPGIGVVGKIIASGLITQSTSLDLAESFRTVSGCSASSTCPVPAEVVCASKTQTEGVYKCDVPYDRKAVGVVSTKPGFVLDGTGTEEAVLVALAGRVPVKVSTENGPIEVGDYLTSSYQPGIAMKATAEGATIGRALEAYDGPGVGQVVVFIDNSFARPAAPQFTALTSSSSTATSTLAGLAELSVTGDPTGIGPILAQSGIDMASSTIINVAMISGVGGKWKIDENGDFTTSGEIVKTIATSQGEKKFYPIYNSDPTIMLTGSGELLNGEARIIFDPALSEIIEPAIPIKTSVTLTSDGAQGLYVAEKSVGDILVKEINGGKGGARFDYIIVATRKMSGAVNDGGTQMAANPTPPDPNFPNSLIPSAATSTTPSSILPLAKREEGGGAASASSTPVASAPAGSTTSTIENPVATNDASATSTPVASTPPPAPDSATLPSATSTEPVATETASSTPVAVEALLTS